MTSPQLIVCKYCGRDNFRSQRGLRMHLQKNRVCRVEHQEEVARLEEEMVTTLGTNSSPQDDKEEVIEANITMEVEVDDQEEAGEKGD